MNPSSILFSVPHSAAGAGAAMAAVLEGTWLNRRAANSVRRFAGPIRTGLPGTLGPLLVRMTAHTYPAWGLGLLEWRVNNNFGNTLLLHEFSVAMALDFIGPEDVIAATADRLRVNTKPRETIFFLPPHYWNDGRLRITRAGLETVFYRSAPRVKPLPLYPGSDLVFNLFYAERRAGVKAGALWAYLRHKQFRRAPGHRIMLAHMHTKYSDGHGTLVAGARRLREAGVDIGLWTDHDVYLSKAGLRHLERETRQASTARFLALSRPELTSTFWYTRQKGKLMGHACYLTPAPVTHISSRKVAGGYRTVEGAIDVVARAIVNQDRGVCWIAHPAMGRKPEELLAGWNECLSMLEWSNFEWTIAQDAVLSKYRENFGRPFFDKLDLLLRHGYRPGIIAGVDFHAIKTAGHVFAKGVVNYLNQAALSAESVVACLQARRFYVGTGEVTPKTMTLRDGTLRLKVDSVFPLRALVIATDKGSISHSLASCRAGTITVPLGALAPAKWWRAEVWDIANNPLLTQPRFLRPDAGCSPCRLKY